MFKLWRERGLDQLAKLYEGGTMESFEGLKNKYSLQQSHFYHYLQIRHYIPKNIHAPNESFLEDILKQPIPRRFLSHVYETFGLNSNYSTDHIRKQWQSDIDCQIDENVWATIIENTLTILSCNADRERPFKILHRLHCTPRLRGGLGLGSPKCPKCDIEVGTHVHMFWKCVKIQKFWREVKNEVVTLVGYDLDLSPLQCILAAKADSARNTHNAKLIGILLYIARKTILNFWISKDTPALDDWYKEVLRVLPLEKLTYTLHENVEGFIKTWQPVLDTVDPAGLNFVLPN